MFKVRKQGDIWPHRHTCLGPHFTHLFDGEGCDIPSVLNWEDSEESEPGERCLVFCVSSAGGIRQKKELSALPVVEDHPPAQNRKQKKVNRADSEMCSSAQSVPECFCSKIAIVSRSN